MAISSPEVLFFQVVEECIAGTIAKEQALQQLEIRYKSVHKDIKKELGEDHISFCCYVPCELEEWIKTCDGAERNKPRDSKWNNSQKIIQKVIEKVTTKYKENELSTENVESEATTDVYEEVFRIQDLCRENKGIEELYEKYKAEIEDLPDKEAVFSNPALNVVFALYPQFQKDYEVMKNNYFIVTETGLKWIKSKQCLAEYFGKLPIPRNRKKRNWKDLEILFEVKDLKNSFSPNGNAYTKMLSEDYETLQELLLSSRVPLESK